MIPYTYFLRWNEYDLNYYGCRYAKGCNPSDLFKTYFTSSKKVHDLVSEGKYPDIISIRKIFTEPKHAVAYENKFLKRIKAAQSPKWINRHNGGTDFHVTEETAKKISIAKRGKLLSEITRQKMSQVRTGRPCSKETRSKISQAQKGRPLSQEHRKALSGRRFTNDHRNKLSMARLGKPSPRKGVRLSHETKQKISETKRKIRETDGKV